MDASGFRQEALDLYSNYLRVQAQVTAIENAAMEAAQGYSRAAAVILLNRPDTDKGYEYLSLCKERDQLMKRSELAATIAMMLEQIKRA